MSSIITALSIVGLTAVFMGLFLGQSLAEQSYPPFFNVNFGSCAGNPLSVIGCWVSNVGALIINLFIFLYGTVVFFINILTFNVPGAPSWIRTIIGTLMGGTVLWSIATALFRGSKS
jgi:hypothetical protein